MNVVQKLCIYFIFSVVILFLSKFLVFLSNILLCKERERENECCAKVVYIFHIYFLNCNFIEFSCFSVKYFAM